MAVVATWWTATKQQVDAGSRFFEESGASKKGRFGGDCFHLTCRNTGADWFNTDNARYYCEACATGINATSARQGLKAPCSKHI